MKEGPRTHDFDWILLAIVSAICLMGMLEIWSATHDSPMAGMHWRQAIWIGVGFVFRGVATTVSAISDPQLPGRAWSIFVGILSLLAGIVVIASPFDSIVTLALVVGIWFVVIGVFEIVSSFGIRKASRSLGH